MKRLMFALVGLALLAPLAGCASPTATNSAATGDLYNFDTGPAGPGLTTHIGSTLVVLYAVPPDGKATMVDYVIVDQKTKSIVYHIENFDASRNFRLELERNALPPGIYRMRVFADKAMTPFDDREVTMS